MIFAAARTFFTSSNRKKPSRDRLVRLQAVARVDRQLEDLLGRRRRDFLDVDAAGRAHHEHRLLRGAVEDDADVRFGGDVGRRRDEHLLHRAGP